MHWPYGGQKKKQKCICGSNNLTAVAGSYYDDCWIYHDRKGNVKKIVPRDTPTQIICKVNDATISPNGIKSMQ